jgi:hypothetical protein
VTRTKEHGLAFGATEVDEGRPLDVGRQRQASNQAVRLGSKDRGREQLLKSQLQGWQVRVEKVKRMNRRRRIESNSDVVETVGVPYSREQLGELSANRPSDDRCIGGTISAHRLFCGTRELWSFAIEGNDKR